MKPCKDCQVEKEQTDFWKISSLVHAKEIYGDVCADCVRTKLSLRGKEAQAKIRAKKADEIARKAAEEGMKEPKAMARRNAMVTLVRLHQNEFEDLYERELFRIIHLQGEQVADDTPRPKKVWLAL